MLRGCSWGRGNGEVIGDGYLGERGRLPMVCMTW